MQPIAAGSDFPNDKYPRVAHWMEQVKQQTEPFYSEAHLIPMKMRETILKNEKSKL